MDIKNKKIKEFPNSPGVYIMKDDKGQPLYIGKAKSIRKRIASHFQKAGSQRISLMLSQVRKIDFITTGTEYKALLLEAELIKKNQPYYNVDLRDDKSFPWIRISRDKFPVISIARPKKKTDADYFGPYTNAKLLRQALKAIRKVFPFCSCQNRPKKPCLYYRIHLCPGPYAGKVSRKDYLSNIKHIKLFLKGKHNNLLKSLSQKMKASAKQQKFEQASLIRDKIIALSSLLQTGARDFVLPTQINLGARYELGELKKLLHLARLPRRIEAFDVSNIRGRQPCGSMVSFLNGAPDKNNYRRFKIKTVKGIDDYRMLSEVIQRRYRRLIQENSKLPDLILIDGGRGHLNIAKGELNNLHLKIPMISIAKQHEEIFTLNKATSIRLNADSKALQLIQRIRNEAHRFAIKYHKLLRKKKILSKA